MRKIKITMVAIVSDEIAEDMKNEVLSGSIQRGLLADEGAKSVKVTMEFLDKDLEQNTPPGRV